MTLPATKDKSDPRENALIDYLAEGYTIQKAGKLAGYSESYYKTDITQKWQSDRFIAKLLKRHRAKAVELLPKSHTVDTNKFLTAENVLSDLQGAISKTGDEAERLELYKTGMGILSKLDHTQERIAKTAGLLKEDNKPTQVIVPIKDMQLILNQTITSDVSQVNDIPDAEVVSSSADEGNGNDNTGL